MTGSEKTTHPIEAKDGVYWLSSVPETDDFGDPIGRVVIDAATRHGPWALMTPASWARHGRGLLGTGHGQMYVRTDDGRWPKVEG